MKNSKEIDMLFYRKQRVLGKIVLANYFIKQKNVVKTFKKIILMMD